MNSHISNHRSAIRFGTDGWRAIIADNFTFENVRIVAQAFADFLSESACKSKGVAIGYDTRFLSKHFALTMAETLAANDVPVYLSDGFCPTPMLSHAVRHRQLAAGIMITASHNPYIYNGVKFKAEYGGPAMVEMTKAIEKHLFQRPPETITEKKKANIIHCDFFPDYWQHLNEYLDLALISRFRGRVFFDAMHGAGCGFMQKILSDYLLPPNKGTPSLQLLTIHQKPHPQFDGLLPEPIPQNLQPLAELVRTNKGDLGLAIDGDGDRFGVVDHNGQFVQLHDLMPLLFRYLVESRRWSGDVVRTTSMANTIDKLAAKYHRQTIEVPVGFKNVAEVMIRQDILIGGEESGGFGYKNHLPERDGFVSCLLLLEMLAAHTVSIASLVQGLRKEFGAFAYGRIDRYGELDRLQKRMSELRQQPPNHIGAFKVEKINLIDGIKFYFNDDSWMLMRVSDTEPLFRIYVGSNREDKVNKLLAAGEQLMQSG